MKDTAIPYDIVHQHQHQQQHPHHQHHNGNTQRQHQTHTTSVYGVHTNHLTDVSQTQRPSGLTHQQDNLNQQALINQYHQPHHQMQSTTHHNTPAAYYQANMYQNYQDHDIVQHPHAHTSGLPVSTTGSNPAAVAAQHQHDLHHTTATNNSQAPGLGHGGWATGINTMASQGHHSMNHTSMAYLTHAYQNHNTPISDHHRNANATMSSQPLGNSHQSSNYVSSLYDSPAAAAATAGAYGYNNYGTAFFQTPTTGQSAHPSTTNLSAFWNHNQANQNRTTHSHTTADYNSGQHRPIVSEQASGYPMHDPRLYYSRPNYGQGIHSFDQPAHTPTTAPDVSQNRALQQPMVIPGQSNTQNLHSGHQLSAHNSTSDQQSLFQQQQQQQPDISHQTHMPVTSDSDNLSSKERQNSPAKNSPRQESHVKDDHTFADTESHRKKSAPHDQSSAAVVHNTNSDADQGAAAGQKVLSRSSSGHSQRIQHSNNNTIIRKLDNGKASMVRTDSSVQYTKNGTQNTSPQQQNRVRTLPDERGRHYGTSRRMNNDRNTKFESNSPSSQNSSRQREASPTVASIEAGTENLSISANVRKTTWASIAGQPAKISQPKSLKSKIASSNSVLPSAKHLAAVNLDTSSFESKNGINPALKNSVSSAAAPAQRNSVPPPIAKVLPVVSSLKLDILGEETESGRISWPAVNASMNPDNLSQETPAYQPNMSSNDDKEPRRDNLKNQRELREPYNNRDYNHNHGYGGYPNQRQEMSRDHWGSRDRRDPRDYRVRGFSDRKNSEGGESSSDRTDLSQRRDIKPMRRPNNYRYGDDNPTRDTHRRVNAHDRHEMRHNEVNANNRFPLNKYGPRDNHYPSDDRHEASEQRQINTDHTVGRDESKPESTGDNKPITKRACQPNPMDFNPEIFDLEPANARYFIIKSYSEEDIHRSIKYSIWCSTNHGNKRLDKAFRTQEERNGPLYLFFSVNGSGHFCGIAEMTSGVDFDSSSGVWAQSKWQGEFSVKWIYVKDVPNNQLRHITLENNEDKPVTNSRDTQEVPREKGEAVLKIIHQYAHTSSLFDHVPSNDRKPDDMKYKKPDHPRDHYRGSTKFGRPYVNPNRRQQ